MKLYERKDAIKFVKEALKDTNYRFAYLNSMRTGKPELVVSNSGEWIVFIKKDGYYTFGITLNGIKLLNK